MLETTGIPVFRVDFFRYTSITDCVFVILVLYGLFMTAKREKYFNDIPLKTLEKAVRLETGASGILFQTIVQNLVLSSSERFLWRLAGRLEVSSSGSKGAGIDRSSN